MEFLIARNPDPDSRLPYLIRLPIAGGLVFRAGGTWPRIKAIYCHPVPVSEWPEAPAIVERVPVRSCVRRGGAIDLVLDRARENRSQIVYASARGREAVFWQSARTRKQARPDVRTPKARAAGISDLQIIVDAHEQYAYRFADKQVSVVRRALPCGDYGTTLDGRLVAVVERKSLSDLVSSVISGALRFALGELAALPRAAVVVEDRYSQLFKTTWARPAVVADGLAELQVRWPNVPIVFCENRSLAEEYVYRYLGAAHTWAATEDAALQRLGAPMLGELTSAPDGPGPSTAEVRRWARQAGLAVPDRGRLRPEVWMAWQDVHGAGDADLRPAESVPAEGVPAEGVPAEGVPAEGVPAEGVPAEGVPAEDDVEANAF